MEVAETVNPQGMNWVAGVMRYFFGRRQDFVGSPDEIESRCIAAFVWMTLGQQVSVCSSDLIGTSGDTKMSRSALMTHFDCAHRHAVTVQANICLLASTSVALFDTPRTSYRELCAIAGRADDLLKIRR